MCDSEPFADFPESFHGVVRLFPLPNLVMFPHVVQPLHIFEPRYRELMEDALASDSLIAMALLKPGWEKDYEGRPPIAPVVCIGGVVAHKRTDDGCYNLLLRGLKRARIVCELPPTRAFRSAEAMLLDDNFAPDQVQSQTELRGQLLCALRSGLSRRSATSEEIDKLVDADLPLSALTDVIAFAVDLPLADKQELLAEPIVERRAALLIQRLEKCASQQDKSRGFPPDFSAN